MKSKPKNSQGRIAEHTPVPASPRQQTRWLRMVIVLVPVIALAASIVGNVVQYLSYRAQKASYLEQQTLNLIVIMSCLPCQTNEASI